MKRLYIAMAITVALMCFGGSAMAATVGTTSDGLQYLVDTKLGECIITGYTDAFVETYLKIPAEINGYPVTQIAESAFAANWKITRVSLPDTIRIIGDRAFYMCFELGGVYTQEGLEYIGSSAFARCTKLTWFSVPETVTDMGPMVFEDCTAMTSLALGDGTEGLTNIPRHAFAGCTSLKTVLIPTSVKTIHTYAFEGCTSLTKLGLYEGNLRVISDRAFADCTSLREVTLPDCLTSLSDTAFEGCSLSGGNVPVPTVLTAMVWLDEEESVCVGEAVTGSYLITGTTGEVEAEAEWYFMDENEEVFSQLITLTALSGELRYIPNKPGLLSLSLYVKDQKDEVFGETMVINVLATDGEIVRIPGDADGNSSVTLADAQAILSGNVSNEANADVTGDGKVDTQDVLRIMQYLAGWGVTLQ